MFSRHDVKVATAVVLGSVVLLAPALALPGQPPQAPSPDPMTRLARDSGPGELLRVVIGGVFASEQEALAANEAMAFGDVAGYFVVPTEQFLGLREQLGAEANFVLASVFRTDAGAEDFVELAQGFGAPALLVPGRVASLGGRYAGLGQESDPRGRGPLTGPIVESLP